MLHIQALHHQRYSIVLLLQVLEAFRAWPMKDPDGRPSTKLHAAQPTAVRGGNKAKPSAAARPAPNASSASDAPNPAAVGRPAEGGAAATVGRATAAAELSPHTAQPATKDAPPSLQYTDSGAQVPVGNGGVGPDGAYVWTQTLQDCTVHIPVPASCTGRHVKGGFKSTSVDITVADAPGAALQGELGGDVVPDECLYTLDRDANSCTLTVTFEKRTETWWRSVLKGHPEIDAGLVDSTRHVSEYDDETQATIRKLVVRAACCTP